MREIKFKAWNTKLEKWIDDIDLSMDGVVVLNTAQTFGGAYVHEPILMQYTGLKDKNGKEIYEGDIVKDKYGETYSVEYKKDCFVVEYQKGDFSSVFWLSDKTGGIEIIGNKFENLELLNNLTK